MTVTARSVQKRYSPEAKTIKEFKSLLDDEELDLTPPYQRGNVWKHNRQSLLIDSIWRGLPIGSITIYQREDGIWEIVDGKQRLTTVLHYLDGRLVPRPKARDALRADEEPSEADEAISVGDDVAAAIFGKPFVDLDPALRRAFRAISLPTVEIATSKASEVVQIFYRMNAGLVSLTPQEIRNALYHDSLFLAAAVELTDPALARKRLAEDATDSWFVKRGVYRVEKVARMADVQLMSEILAVVFDDGRVHHRRDKLDEFYGRFQPYRKPTAQDRARLEAARKSVRTHQRHIDELFDRASLRDHGIGVRAEHDLYAIFAAFNAYGLNKTKLSRHLGAMRKGLTEFFKSVDRDVTLLREGVAPEARKAQEKLVRAYATTFTGGQVNGEAKRRTRVDMLVILLTALAGDPPARHSFSQTQRAQIWSLFPMKQCVRCGKDVAWEEFQAGHVVAKAQGGAPELLNGRIEHGRCNQSAGARRSDTPRTSREPVRTKISRKVASSADSPG